MTFGVNCPIRGSSLDQYERRKVYDYIKMGFSDAEIADMLHRKNTMIAREIRKHSDSATGRYDPAMPRKWVHTGWRVSR